MPQGVTAIYLKNYLEGKIASGEMPKDALVTIQTEDLVIHTIDDLVYEAPEAENPLDPNGTLWLKVKEY